MRQQMEKEKKTAIVLRNIEENNGAGYVVGIFRSEKKFREYVKRNYSEYFDSCEKAMSEMTIEEISYVLIGHCYSVETGPLE